MITLIVSWVFNMKVRSRNKAVTSMAQRNGTERLPKVTGAKNFEGQGSGINICRGHVKAGTLHAIDPTAAILE